MIVKGGIVVNVESLFKLSYGMYVVASSNFVGRLNGQIANTVFQVASEPILVAASINKSNLTCEFILEKKAFTVSVLSEDTPMEFIGLFGFKSGRNIDKFKDINYKLLESGVPVVLDYTVSFLEVDLINIVDLKTHYLFIGEVKDADILSDRPPMTYAYYHKVKKGKSPKTAPTFVSAARQIKEVESMKKYVCKVCGYVYDPQAGDPEGGIEPGTPFDKLPEDWVCPICGVGKDEFEEE